jgi:hypothetical protein
VVITLNSIRPYCGMYLLPVPSLLTPFHQVPQLWSTSFLSCGGNELQTRRVSSIAQIEAEKEHKANQKAEDRRALEEAKAQEKEAYTVAKAQIAHQRATAAQAKKLEKLRVTAKRQAEKARVAAENRARQTERKVCTPLSGYNILCETFSTLQAAKWKAMSQVVEGVSDGEQCIPPPLANQPHANADKDVGDPNLPHDKFLLHLDDPKNFLKLCCVLHIFVQRCSTNADIDHADRLLREYCIELITVSHAAFVFHRFSN